MASQFPPKKNTAFTLYFTLYKNDGTVIANPGTITKKYSIDGAAVGDLSNAITEEDTTYGQCSIVLTAGEMNGDAIWIYIKDDTTGCVPFTATIYTAAQTLDELDAVADAVKAKTDGLSYVGTDVKATLDSEKVTVTANEDKTGYALAADQPVNVTKIAGSAVNASSAQIGVNVVNWKGSTAVGMSGDSFAVVNNGTYGNAAIKTQLADIHDTDLPAVKADTAAILADTNELQTDWKNGGRLDLLLDRAADGAGAITWTYTVTDGTDPLEGVDVWVTSDVGGATVLARGTTNASGVVTFYLDAGTVYVWSQKSGYTFTNPDQETVS